MPELTGEQIVLIISAVFSTFSAIAVARIKERPESDKTEVDKFSFFYDQYRILYEEAVSRVNTLQIENQELTTQIKKMEQQISELEEILEKVDKKEILQVKEQEKRISQLEEAVSYWKDEARLGYVLLGIENEEDL